MRSNIKDCHYCLYYNYVAGFPAIVVAISLAITQTNGYGNKEACWLDVKSGLIWGFIGPALLIILVSKLKIPFPLETSRHLPFCQIFSHPKSTEA